MNFLKKTEKFDLESALLKKVEKYRKLTEKALSLVLIKAEEGTLGFSVGQDFLAMAQNYFADGTFFEKKGDFLNALAAYSYAHAWLDAGVRAKLFQAEDDKLFTLP